MKSMRQGAASARQTHTGETDVSCRAQSRCSRESRDPFRGVSEDAESVGLIAAAFDAEWKRRSRSYTDC
ncbi:hypothetical protein EYF80_038654 [Liparis tanakae]|uniref:Uncharacterized protein n=1 Tax=Liparis tanakae TaxID=230148 RepID=A0A4Z2GE06_9TELE|nr:hypothetical protein EYF80_038654 [Liparis tanakae]